MRAVYKYGLTLSETQTIQMPRNAKIVHVGVQKGQYLKIWAEIDSEYVDDLVDRRFDIVGTGYIIVKNDAFYVGSVQIIEPNWGDEFVCHIYEVPLA